MKKTIVFLTLCFAASGLLMLHTPFQKIVSTPPTLMFDTFGKNIVFTQFQKDGAIQKILKASSMESSTDITHFRDPLIISYDQQKPSLFLQAKFGEMRAHHTVFYLWNSVEAENGEKTLHLFTSALTLLPHEDYAETKEPVLLLKENTTTYGIGFRAYLKDNIYQLLSETKTTYVPQT